jgi:hypothetical protein
MRQLAAMSVRLALLLPLRVWRLAMTVNEGGMDRILRVIIGLALLYGAWASWPGSVTPLSGAAWSLVMVVFGAIAIVTGLVGWCALYALFGMSTKKRAAA